MKSKHTRNLREARPNWHVWACVLVIGLMLYNPFIALTGGTDTLSYEKLARNRATVGASEMQQFSPVQNDSVKLDIYVVAIGAEIAKAIEAETPGIVVRAERPVPQLETASLWFRPPPAQ